MSTAPRFEIVHADAGWHARFRAANGKIVWTTQDYTRRPPARDALDHFGRYMSGGSTPWKLAILTQRYGALEVRDVDLRHPDGSEGDLGAGVDG